MSSFILFRGILICFFCCLFSLEVKADTFQVSTFEVGESKEASEIARKAYESLGHKIIVNVFPGRRSLFYSNSGQMDAELIRISGTEFEYENLIRIKTPILISKTVVVTSKNSTFTPLKWDDLEGLEIGIPLGVQLLEKKIGHFNPMRVSNSKNLLKLINRGRVQVAVLPYAMAIQHTEEIKQLRIVEPAIENVELFHFIHKKHKGLVKELTQALKKEVERTSN